MIKMEKDFNFTTAFAMRCDAEQFESVRKEFIDYGYNIGYPFNLQESTHIVNNFNNDIGWVGDVESDRANKNNRLVIETFNRDLCLALSAMTDKPDGIVGEWWACNIGDNIQFIENKLYQQIGLVGNFPQFKSEKNEIIACDVTKWFRKATADELIKYFGEEKPFVLPEKWYCPYENREQFEVMKNYFSKTWIYCEPNGFNGCYNDTSNNNWCYELVAEGKTKITFDQFMKYVVNQPETNPQIEALQKRIEELEYNVKQLAESMQRVICQPEPQPASRFADKQPIWAWDNDWNVRKLGVFWDAKNECPYWFNGSRNGNEYDNYEPIPADQIPAWMVEAAKYLED